MSDDQRLQVCREILERVAVIDRIRALADELRQFGHMSFAMGLHAAIRIEHMRIDRLADVLGLSPLMRAADTAAFARAQLGLPIDSPVPLPRRRRSRQSSWERDAAVFTSSSGARTA